MLPVFCYDFHGILHSAWRVDDHPDCASLRDTSILDASGEFFTVERGGVTSTRLIEQGNPHADIGREHLADQLCGYLAG